MSAAKKNKTVHNNQQYSPLYIYSMSLSLSPPPSLLFFHRLKLPSQSICSVKVLSAISVTNDDSSDVWNTITLFVRHLCMAQTQSEFWIITISSSPATVIRQRPGNYPCTTTEQLINLFCAAAPLMPLIPALADMCSFGLAKQELSSKVWECTCWNLIHI